MRPGAKSAKAKVEARLPVARKSRRREGPRVGDLEKRLAEALEQQTATSEILQIISASPTDVQPVFDAIASRVGWSCPGSVDGELLSRASLHRPRGG